MNKMFISENYSILSKSWPVIQVEGSKLNRLIFSISFFIYPK